MKTGASLAFIAVGAIFAFAVTANTSFFNIHTAGYVLIIVGIVGLYFQRRGWTGRQMLVRRTRAVPGVVEERAVPKYVMRNPGLSNVSAGLPVVPSISEEDDKAAAQVPRQPVAHAQPEGQIIEEEFYEE